MTDEEVKEIVDDVYMRCFDDEGKYPDIKNALRIAVENTAERCKIKKMLHYIQDVKIADAAYFPHPQEIYKEIPIADAMGAQAAEYMRAWTFNGLQIIATAAVMDDGREWLHVSVSRKSRLPSYEEMTRIKRDFIGDDKKAISVLPEKKYHVNIHENCLHLFYSAENPLPEFSGGTGLI